MKREKIRTLHDAQSVIKHATGIAPVIEVLGDIDADLAIFRQTQDPALGGGMPEDTRVTEDAVVA
jgi:hypothetical protein